MEGDQSAAKQGAAAMADEAMAEDSTAGAAASTAANSSARVTPAPLGTQAGNIFIDDDEDDPLLGLSPTDPPPLSIPKRTEDPLKWWKKHASSFPPSLN